MRPPGIFRAFLQRVLPRRTVGPSLLGDLHEEYVLLRARRGRVVADVWYGWQALALGLPWFLRGMGRGSAELGRAATRGLGLDLRRTIRGLARSPGTVLVAVGSVGLGIGTAATVAGVAMAAWFPTLPYPQADRLLLVGEMTDRERAGGFSPRASWPTYEAWTAHPGPFERVEAADLRSLEMEGEEGAARVVVASVSAGWADLLGVGTHLGRGIGPADTRADAPPVVVLGHRRWTETFGADPGILGRAIRFDGDPHTVVGVLAPGTRALTRAEAWVALRRDPPSASRPPEARSLMVLARPRSDVTVEAARKRVEATTPTLRRRLRAVSAGAAPPVDAELTQRAALAEPLVADLRAGALDPAAAAAAFTATLLVLLIAVLNLGSLLLARLSERMHELGLRAALGSGRLRLLRAGVLESALLVAAGGLAGLGVAAVQLELLARYSAGSIPGWMTLGLDLRGAGAAALVTLGTVGVCALLPLRSATRVEPGPGQGGRGRSPARVRRQDWLLGAQIAVGVVLLAGALTSVRTFLRVSDFETLGFRWEGLSTVSVELPEARYTAPGQPTALAAVLGERLAAEPGVLGAAAVANVPLPRGADGARRIRADGSPENARGPAVPRSVRAVTPGYLEMRAIGIVAGRGLEDRDGAGARPVVVLSRVAASTLWPDEPVTSVLGRRVLVSDGSSEHGFTVVGVATDVVSDIGSERRTPSPRIYASLAQMPASLLALSAPRMGLLAEVTGPPLRREAVARALATVEPDARVTFVAGVDEVLHDWIAPARLTASALSALGLLALGLLLLGVYGTLSYRVAASRHEIGVRMALGARASEVVRSVISRVGRVLVVSTVVGVVLAIPVSLGLRGGAVPVGSSDVLVLAGVAGLLGVAAAAGALVPAGRALRTDPVASLRGE